MNSMEVWDELDRICIEIIESLKALAESIRKLCCDVIKSRLTMQNISVRSTGFKKRPSFKNAYTHYNYIPIARRNLPYQRRIFS